ncbi:branched-chain-amino-acid aminotransferase-like protein 2 [Acanthaster planci]|uniref:Branched-chain-amino-acid aminotransferase-like protein 2 n=1 Tax=Acanthaster planci TaxID=133434 RepID=A0A8B7YXM9_ACAPL|nr:branched-chain-amino-acid aminotransferase-like protein 2 [Acanthaster planci]XP_022097244.1 branched-chain-amino-acid aminotransferase-like protein 2 [Acanthaster planci]XP_022097245.1 branched-chain-amino-acid aminotransferase-like protein 2 [Acanthaster planci]
MADELNRVFLWGIPRTMTNTLVKCLSYVEGIQIAVQLYADAHFFGPDAKRPVTTPLDPMESKLNVILDGIYKKSKVAASGADPSLLSFKSVRGVLEAPCPGKKVLFCKEQAQYLDGRYDMLPKGFKYSFIIRHPLKLFLSYKKYLHGFVGDFPDMRTLPPILFPPGYGYKEMNDLVEYVRENIEPSPVILDADDLLQDPAGILSTYCSKMGIPYSSKLLSWEPGRDIINSWMGTKVCMNDEMDHAYKHTFESEGFGRPTPVPDLDSLPDDVKACARYSMSYYEDLHRRRIIASG